MKMKNYDFGISVLRKKRIEYPRALLMLMAK